VVVKLSVGARATRPARGSRRARPHSLGLARGAGDVASWIALAASWIAAQAGMPHHLADAPL
jgi:hypothetical protein